MKQQQQQQQQNQQQQNQQQELTQDQLSEVTGGNRKEEIPFPNKGGEDQIPMITT